MLNLRFVAAVVLIVFSLLLCCTGSLISKNIERNLKQIVVKIDRSNVQEDVLHFSNELLFYWNDNNRILSLFLDHEQCDKVADFVSRIHYSAAYGDSESFADDCVQLLQLLDDMLQQEEFSIYNLF